MFALGRDSAVLMLRFSVPLPTTANLVEAYVVLRRSDAVDDDPAPISLHATRIIDGWEQRSISWARQPGSSMPNPGNGRRARRSLARAARCPRSR